MALNYLLDENISPSYRSSGASQSESQFQQRYPELVMWVVGDPGVPPLGTLDPELLCWCEEHNFVLVTNNRRSMPVHLADHLNQNRHILGILILAPKLSIGENLVELALIAEFSFDGEYQDQILHLPLY